MTYGSISPATKEYLEDRASETGILVDKLGLDVLVHTTDCAIGVAQVMSQLEIPHHAVAKSELAARKIEALKWLDDQDCSCDGDVNWSYSVSIIFGGALDEEFYVTTDYEVTIADWLADQCREEVRTKQPGEQWEIIVSEVGDTGVVRYKVSDEMGESA
jgi:hypothetical protein